MNEEKPAENIVPEAVDLEAVVEMAEASKELIPQMNVNVPTTPDKPEANGQLITTEKLA